MPDKLNSTFYTPQVVPSDPAQLPQFLRDMQVQIQGAIQTLNNGGYDKTYVAPAKPRDGDVAYADGIYWNPGSGAGMYQYNGTSWAAISEVTKSYVDTQDATKANIGGSNATGTWPISITGDARSITGAIQMWPTGTAPTGYLLCAGAAVSRTTYAALFAIISTTFGAGDGSTTFNLPNYTNRMPYGTTVGATGGSADAVVVSHTHTVTDPGHDHSYGSYGAFGSVGISGSGVGLIQGYPPPSTSSATTGITLASTGSSAINANLPPYLGINFIIKT